MPAATFASAQQAQASADATLAEIAREREALEEARAAQDAYATQNLQLRQQLERDRRASDDRVSAVAAQEQAVGDCEAAVAKESAALSARLAEFKRSFRRRDLARLKDWDR